MNKSLFVLALALGAGAVQADEIIVHTVSMHTGSKYEPRDGSGERTYNNVNLGVGYGWDNDVTVGTYYNSYREQTVYVAKRWLWSCGLPQLSCGGSLALASGYKDVSESLGGIMPFAALSARYSVSDTLAINLAGVPPISSNTDGVIHLYFSYRFKGD